MPEDDDVNGEDLHPDLGDPTGWCIPVAAAGIFEIVVKEGKINVGAKFEDSPRGARWNYNKLETLQKGVL